MHRIVKAHLESFAESAGYAGEEESRQFELFCNHAVISSRFPSSYDLEDVTTGVDDSGIDGVAIVIDEDIVVSPEDAAKIFSTPRRNHDVDVIFIQAKRSEGFDLGDFLKFKEAILRFCTQVPYAEGDETLSNARQIFDLVVDQVPKIRNGKPSVTIRFVTTGRYNAPAAFEAAKAEFWQGLNELGLFADTDIRFIGRDELTELWVGTYSGIDASLETFSSAPLPPSIAGINEAYLAVVRAKDFVDNLLLSPDGNLRSQVFEENVRSFLGIDNPVNKSISDTLASADAATRFPVLNNGITIVSPDVRLQNNTLHLNNFQIVNGCQTSNVLFEHRDALNNIMVNVKVVETDNEDVFSELVRATNSQTKVEDTQFLSLRPVIKRVEQYFNTFTDPESRLYFERRDRQYVGQDVPAIRTFSLHNATKCVTAMYCNRPELAYRYPKTMYEEFTPVIFADDVKEIVFYSSCLTMYRFSLLVSNNVIPQNMKKFKWHMMPLVRAIICGLDNQPLNSRAIEKSANQVIARMAQHGAPATDVFMRAVEICRDLGEVTSDRLKRQAILSEMLSRL